MLRLENRYMYLNFYRTGIDHLAADKKIIEI